MSTEITRGIIFFLFLSVGALVVYQPSKKIGRTIYWNLFLIVVLLITFRPSTMADYQNYENAFLLKGDLRFEPSFQLIAYISNLFSNPVIVGFFLYALITCFVRFMVMYSHWEIVWLAMLVYLSEVLIIQDMVAIRAAGAGAMLLLAVYLRSQNHYKLYVISLVGAIMFHYTAIVLLSTLLMSLNKPRRILYLSLVVVSYMMAMNGTYLTSIIERMSFIGAYFLLFDSYFNEMNLQMSPMNIFNLLQLGHLLICIVFWIYIGKIANKNSMGLILLKLYTIGICCVPWFAQSFPMAIRFSELFFVVEILLIPIGFTALWGNNLKGKLVLLAYCTIIFAIRMSDMQYWLPETILQNK